MHLLCISAFTAEWEFPKIFGCNTWNGRLVMFAKDAAPRKGFEWRILLGPSNDWPVFRAEPDVPKQQRPATECCELCREPIDSSKPFTTNSAGEQPIHLACLNGDAEIAGSGHSSSRVMGGRWLWKLFGFESAPQSQVSTR